MRVIGLLALLEGKETALSLADYLSEQAAPDLKTIVEGYSEKSGGAEALRWRLKTCVSQESFSGLDQIHPAWLLETLKKESPRVIGVILRHLPSKHVRYLLEHLPRHLTARLPKLVEAFYVPSEILNEVRRRFESHFVPMPVSHQIESFSFEHLYYLKAEELEILFHELGLSELSLSFVGSPRRVLNVMLNRFNIREAKEILSRLKQFQTEPGWFFQDARYSVLELVGVGLGAQAFLAELGILSMAKAFDRSQIALFETLKQKLAPERAYLLKRYLEEQWGAANSQTTGKRQEWVLEHLRQMSNKGLVDGVWQMSLRVPEGAKQSSGEIGTASAVASQ